MLLKIKRRIALNRKKKFVSNIQIKVIADLNIVKQYVEQCTLFDNLQIVNEFNDRDNARKYVYAPKSNPMDSNQFREAMFSLLGRNLDYILVSSTLDDYPIIGACCIEDAIIYKEKYNVAALQKDNSISCGKLLRLPGYNKIETCININEAISGISLVDESFLLKNILYVPEYHNQLQTKIYNKKKKMVFVMPIFMAVGGVERNTIEIMRCLQEEYDFCVITMERHSKGQGSLNYQLNKLCVANYDLRELVEYNDYFSAMEQLKSIYNPDIIWLCNNSNWLEDNLLEFRRLFSKQAIVAQDVYDTKYGWIEYYNREGIHLLDRYIAINKKIEECFINQYSISKDKIDVIYPAVDDGKIRKEIDIPIDREAICKKYGLNPTKKYFAYVGRLMDQKNPLRYVRLATKAINKYSDMEWIIVGDGALAAQVEDAIKANNMTDKIKRIPYVSNVPELYKVIDGLVIVSYYEGMPIVSIEAMSMGVPIFGTDVGDLKIFVDKYNCGNIISIDKQDDFEAFELWYKNYLFYKKNAEKNALNILDFFSANNLALLYKETFEKALKDLR